MVKRGSPLGLSTLKKKKKLTDLKAVSLDGLDGQEPVQQTEKEKRPFFNVKQNSRITKHLLNGHFSPLVYLESWQFIKQAPWN